MLNIIPKPNYVEAINGQFYFSKNTEVNFDERFSRAQEIAMPFFKRAQSLLIRYKEKTTISFIFDGALSKEEYVIKVASGETVCTASSEVGALYAFMSLRQMLLLDTVEEGDLIIKEGILIKDKPVNSYRGFLLDVARHFSPVPYVKKLIDMLALIKINVLHLHLSDNQGWRIQIKKYPLLTTIGSYRKDSIVGGWQTTTLRGEPHSGYYTQEDIRELVSYAEKRGIMIIPEIDAPAHFNAVLAAYPELSCTGEKIEVPTTMGGITDTHKDLIMCAGKEESFEFLFDVIDEICELFPAPYFHIGGDEAPKDKWKVCPLCQKRMKDNGLKDEEQLQGYLNNRIAAYLATKGKHLMGWNEVLQNSNLTKDAIIQYWTEERDKKVEKFVAEGGKVVISKHQAFYFDMSYGFHPVKPTYNYSHKSLHIKDASSVMGIEAALWTEFTLTNEEKEIKIFPRLQALAEVAWTEDRLKNYKDWQERFYTSFANILDKHGITYADKRIINPCVLKKAQAHWTFMHGDPNADLHKQQKLHAQDKADE